MLTKLLFANLRKSIELDLRIIYVAGVYTDPMTVDEVLVETEETQIEQELRTQFDILFPADELQNVYVVLSGDVV